MLTCAIWKIWKFCNCIFHKEGKQRMTTPIIGWVDLFFWELGTRYFESDKSFSWFCPKSFSLLSFIYPPIRLGQTDGHLNHRVASLKKTIEGGGGNASSPPKKRLEPDILTDCLLYTLIVLKPKNINGQVYDTGFKINNFRVRKDKIKKNPLLQWTKSSLKIIGCYVWTQSR